MTKCEAFTLYPERPVKVEMTDNLNLKLTSDDKYIFINLSDDEVRGFAAQMNAYVERLSIRHG